MHRPRRWALLAALATIAPVIAACGGPSAPVVRPPVNTPRAALVTAKVVDQHVCDPRDFAQGCALPIATIADIARGVDPVTQGVDFGWSCPVSVARNFGASYLSYDTSKDWTSSCVSAFHRAGKATVAVWEAGASDATGGYNLGYSQAKRAAQELSALGAPKGQPFDMAIDCDCTGPSVASYFKGADAAEPGRVNDYGDYYVTLWLYQHGLVGRLNWETYAWSGGRWLPASIAPLEQYLNSNAVDYDRAIASNYAQWPYAVASVAKPKPKVDPYAVFLPNIRVTWHGVAAREYDTVKTWDRFACGSRIRHNHRRHHVCSATRRDLVALRSREAWLAGHRKGGWNVYHLRARYRAISHRLA